MRLIKIQMNYSLGYERDFFVENRIFSIQFLTNEIGHEQKPKMSRIGFLNFQL